MQDNIFFEIITIENIDLNILYLGKNEKILENDDKILDY